MLKKVPPLILLLVSLLMLPRAQAQALNNPCPGGGVPSGGRCVSPGQAAANRSSSSGAPIQAEYWESRYGAIVFDPETGALYPVENQTSKRNAVKGALEYCGKKDCELSMSVRNGCLASSWGGGHFTRGAETKAHAEQLAMDACLAKARGPKCELKYSGCSFPVLMVK